MAREGHDFACVLEAYVANETDQGGRIEGLHDRRELGLVEEAGEETARSGSDANEAGHRKNVGNPASSSTLKASGGAAYDDLGRQAAPPRDDDARRRAYRASRWPAPRGT